MRAIVNLSLAMALVAMGVVACGGGGGGPSIAGGGGGSSSSSSSSSVSCVATGGTNTSSAPNVATVIVDPGPACAQSEVQGQTQGQVNVLYTTVVLCAPGSTTNCQTIDHVQVDTGSYGLRILSQALEPSLAQALTPVIESQHKEALAECTQFADGYSWGPIVNADMKIAGEQASGLEVQVIGDPGYEGNIPSDCSGTGGTAENTVADFGANGILGVGPFIDDCGSQCAQAAQPHWYYVCPTPSTCTLSAVSETQQISNPVAFLVNGSNGVQDDNGIILALQAIPDAGAATDTGTLTFGIGTESNNTLTATTILTGDPSNGNITTTYPVGGTAYPASYIDSGSNAYFFVDSTLRACTTNTGFYCPTSPASLSAVNQGVNGVSSTVDFTITDADNLNGAYSAFDDLGGSPLTSGSQQSQQSNQTFDWGLPFFFGRSVFTGIAGRTQPGAAQGPYFAY